MTPAILIVGATGNTGRSVTSTLPTLLQHSSTLSSHRIIALTRSLSSPTAQHLSTLPGVSVIEHNWTEITPAWLRKHQVTRAFIASHNEPTQFAEESTFLIAALAAGVEYVVRISTTAANVRPDCQAYYPRSHWAIEAMLSAPEFANLQWTSLQPNVFSQFYLAPAVQYIKEYNREGRAENPNPLRLMASEDAPVGIIDSDEVGIFAARLLAHDDVAQHNKAKYVMNGPEDITGRQIVEMVAQRIGRPVQDIDVSYGDMSFLESYYEQKFAGQSRNVIMSIRHAPETAWEGKCTAATTSEEVLRVAAPRRTPADVLESLLG